MPAVKWDRVDIKAGEWIRLVYDGKILYGDEKSIEFVQELIRDKEMSQVRRSAQINVAPEIPPQGSPEFYKELIRRGIIK